MVGSDDWLNQSWWLKPSSPPAFLHGRDCLSSVSRNKVRHPYLPISPDRPRCCCGIYARPWGSWSKRLIRIVGFNQVLLWGSSSLLLLLPIPIELEPSPVIMWMPSRIPGWMIAASITSIGGLLNGYAEHSPSQEPFFFLLQRIDCYKALIRALSGL